MSGNDARYDADSAVLVAAKQKARSRSMPRCNGSLASIQLSRQQKWGWSGWGWMPIEGERLQLRPVAAAPCGS